MSYILDALRKSDQQRQRGAAPTLPAGQTPAVAPRQPAFLAYGLIAAVLLGAGVAIGWLRPWQTEQAAPTPPKPPAQAALATAMPAPALAPPPAQVKPESGVAKRAAGTAGSVKSAAPEQTAAGRADAPRAQSVISMSDLPLSIQQELPAMAISVHAYSGNPPDRMVGINNRMLREGGEVAPGLKLEQITPDGMIFGYKGYSFRRGVK